MKADVLESPAEKLRTEVRVLKFGGSSLLDAERIRRVVEVVREARGEARPVVVVSALGGVTDQLAELAELAADGEEPSVDPLRERHLAVLGNAASDEERERTEPRLEESFRELRDLLHGIRLLRECSPRVCDRVLGMGEILSSRIVAAAIRTAGTWASAVDARELIRTDERYGSARVDEGASFPRIRARLEEDRDVPVVTGFIASTRSGEATTLGRGGSDYTATLVAAALGAERVELWTDVNGVRTADPRVVRDAEWVEELAYEELLELATFGAKVVHPAAVRPARSHRIPVVIRNTAEPEFPGTRVVEKPEWKRLGPAQGISAIRDVALVRLEGIERIGVTEAAERLFRALRTQGVAPLLFSQDSSAHSLSFAVQEDDVESVTEALLLEFERERAAGLLRKPVVERGRSVLALVGEGMHRTPGISGHLFRSLGAEGINVQAIAQGSSERNISWVVSGDDEVGAVRAVHRTFFASPGPPPLPLYVVGTGGVGSALLDRLATGGLDALASAGVRPYLAGVLRSERAIVAPEGVEPSRWRELLDGGSGDPREALEELSERGGPGVVVDCTASPQVADRYEPLLESDLTVVTASKLALSGSLSRYRRLRELGREGRRLFYRTTVGASVPMLEVLSELHESGAKVHALEGLLSGSLAFLFHSLDAGGTFRSALREARERGFTEPDPRADLRLDDVVRKLLILAREIDVELEPGAVSVKPALPPELLEEEGPDGPFDLPAEADEWMAHRLDEARREGGRILPVARLEKGRATVALEVVPAGSPLRHLRGTENLLEVRTDTYDEYPMVIRGPGAGPGVTAEGLLNDLVLAARSRAAEARKEQW